MIQGPLKTEVYNNRARRSKLPSQSLSDTQFKIMKEVFIQDSEGSIPVRHV